MKLALFENKPMQVLERSGVIAANDFALIVQIIGCRIVGIEERRIDRRKIPHGVSKEPVRLKSGITIRADDLATIVDPEDGGIRGANERYVDLGEGESGGLGRGGRGKNAASSQQTGKDDCLAHPTLPELRVSRACATPDRLTDIPGYRADSRAASAILDRFGRGDNVFRTRQVGIHRLPGRCGS